MQSRKSIRKSERARRVSLESLKRFSELSWALYLAEGDEITPPAPESEQEQLRAKFWAAAAVETAATERVNLRNVAARFKRGRITKDEIPAVCERVRRSIKER